MKHFLCMILSAAILSAAVLCGCGSDNKNQTEHSVSAQSSAQNKTLATESSATPSDSASEADKTASGAIDNSHFGFDGSFKTYSKNGVVISQTGIDVSSYSGNIDWQKVKAAGVEFVMVRLGGRGYGGEGTLYADDKALDLIQGAQNAGLKTGGYFFSQAITEAEAVEEAQYIKTMLGDITLDYPIAYDLETIEDDDARTDSLTAAQATGCAKAFCESVKDFGTPMIYAKSNMLSEKYDLTQLAAYDIWYSEYAGLPSAPCGFAMWQYSESGTIDGIDGAVDLNISLTDLSAS